jgi:hypothetical protein
MSKGFHSAAKDLLAYMGIPRGRCNEEGLLRGAGEGCPAPGPPAPSREVEEAVSKMYLEIWSKSTKAPQNVRKPGALKRGARSRSVEQALG